jgi:tetratricopeptide (TPR) repeat protein
MCEYWLADYRGAISNYDRAIELNPACSGYYCNRGQSKFELGETSAALADYNRAIQLDPKNAQAYLNRGTLKACAQTNLTDAVADFTKAIEAHTDPQEYEIFFVRGNAKKELKDFTGAVADYTKALQLNPKYEPARTNLAIAQNALHGRKEK